MLYATLSTRQVQRELREATALQSNCSNYDSLIAQYAQSLKIGLQSFRSAVVYIRRSAK